MEIQINEPLRTKLQATPWALSVAAGAGVMSFLVCRALFKQTKAAALLQSYIVLTSTLGALKAASACEAVIDSCIKEGSESEPARPKPKADKPLAGAGSNGRHRAHSKTA